jgi:uncharacterized protein YbbK (DUF523 family)
MNEFPKPNVVVSKCLGFAKCRYDGDIVLDAVVDKLKPFISYITVCPEVEIGLGIPRDPIRIISDKGKLYLYQPATNKDLTRAMTKLTKIFLSSLTNIDGFILKSRSPSCGINRVKVYKSYSHDAKPSSGVGFFATAVINKFPDLAITDESRLKNLAQRKNFYTKLFTIARFRMLRRDIKENEYLLNQTFLNPFPQELIEITDSGKGRNR